MINQISIKTEFEVGQNEEGIYLMSDDFAFLKEKWDLIADYTKKIDPLAKIGTFKVEKVDDEMFRSMVAYKKNQDIDEYNYKRNQAFDKAYVRRDDGTIEFDQTLYEAELKKLNKKPVKTMHNYVNLQTALPRVLAALHGDHLMNKYHGNCHGAALVASGLFPVMTSIDSPFAFAVTTWKTDQVSLDKLSSGDLLYHNKHSFVYLDPDLSLSMNGIGQPLLLQKTDEILKKYELDLKDFQILRKKENWSYPESVMLPLMEFYGFADNTFAYQLPSDRCYNRLLPIAKAFQELAESSQADKNVSFIYNELFKVMNKRLNCPIEVSK